MEKPPRRTPIVFYRTPAGSEVVRDWLRGLDQADRNIVGQDLMRVQFVGRSACRSAVPWAMDCGKCAAILRAIGLHGCSFASRERELVALHGFIKKTQKTPDAELKLARRRMREFK